MKALFIGTGVLFGLAGLRMVQYDLGLAFFAALIFVAYMVMTFLWTRLGTE